MTRAEWAAMIGTIVGLLGVVLVVIFLGALPTMLLWGYLMPTLFPTAVASGAIVAKITFWQAFWLSIFCAILFKSITVKS